MIVAVDTNIIVYVLTGTEQVAAAALEALKGATARGGLLVISAPVYAELLALPDWTQTDLDSFIPEAKIRVDWIIGKECWIAAGVSFAAYSRRRSRQKLTGARRLLADFIIGAHANGVGRLLTSDASFYRTNFPGLGLQTPTV